MSVCEFSIQIKKEIVLGKHKKICYTLNFMTNISVNFHKKKVLFFIFYSFGLFWVKEKKPETRQTLSTTPSVIPSDHEVCR